MIHDIDMSALPEFEQSGYPEPDYAEVGRARILHVFKDRGETSEWEPAPRDFERIPVLSGV
ncbi:MAG: hypothetical protein ACKV0T_16480 [Planctomycetales bacterium]